MKPTPIQTARTALRQAGSRAKDLLPILDGAPQAARVTPNPGDARAQQALQALRRHGITTDEDTFLRDPDPNAIGASSLQVRSIERQRPQGTITRVRDFEVCGIRYPDGGWPIQNVNIADLPPDADVTLTLQAQNAVGTPASLRRIQYAVKNPRTNECLVTAIGVTGPSGLLRITIRNETLQDVSEVIVTARLLRGPIEAARLGTSPKNPVMNLILTPPPPTPEPEPEPEPPEDGDDDTDDGTGDGTGRGGGPPEPEVWHVEIDHPKGGVLVRDGEPTEQRPLREVIPKNEDYTLLLRVRNSGGTQTNQEVELTDPNGETKTHVFNLDPGEISRTIHEPWHLGGDVNEWEVLTFLPTDHTIGEREVWRVISEEKQREEGAGGLALDDEALTTAGHRGIR